MPDEPAQADESELPETLIKPSDRHERVEPPQTVIADSEPKAESTALADPKGETVDVPSGDATPAPQGWRSRLRRGLARHEGEREDDPQDLLSSTRFEVESVIGEGGMGIVCVAHDASLGRRVAIKLLRPGSEDSPERLQRFQIEARAAARLRHPNVVTVHEVGEEGGRPYLVMDYVVGESLEARIAREGQLDGPTSARIAKSVAEALHYAHTQALLHRDVKPANVLLAEDGTALLTDFGLAKEIESDSQGPTVSGQIMGTPAYMPPEQAQGEMERLDRRADVYSLGATLYACLVGHPPFREPKLPKLLRAVVEQEPPAPRALRPEVDRDLETICLRCLEKEPEERYDSAKALAEELGRYLRHEPILARPPGLGERGRKWIRRNPTLTRGLGLSLAGALVVVAVSTVFFLQGLKRERDLAKAAQTSEAQQRQIAEDEAARAEREAAEARRQAKRAEDRARIARDAVRALVHEVEGELGDLPGEPIRAALLRLQRTALAKLEELQQTEDPGSIPAVERVDAWTLIGELAISAGDLARALEGFEAATLAAREHLAQRPRDPETWLRLEKALYGVARVRLEQGEFTAVREAIAETETVYQRLVDLSPSGTRHHRAHAGTLCELGNLEAHLGDSQAAVATYEQALGLLRKVEVEGEDETFKLQRSMDLALNRLGLELVRLGRLDDAHAALQESLAHSRARVEASPESVTPLRDLGTALDALSDVARSRGQLDRAMELALESQAISERLAALDPSHARYQDDVAISLERLANLHKEQGRPAQALEALKRAAKLRRAQTQADSNPANQLNLAAVLNLSGQVLYALGRPDEVLQVAKEAEAAARAVLAKDARLVGGRSRLARALALQGDVYRDRRELAAALQAYEDSKQQTQLEVEAEPENTAHLADLTVNLDRLGQVYLGLGRLPDALRTFRSGLDVARRLVEADPQNAVYRDTLGTGHDNVGQAEQALGNLPAALKAYAQARQVFEALVAATPSNFGARRHLAVIHGRTGTVYQALQDPRQADASLGASAEFLGALAREAPEQSHIVRDYSVSLFAHAQFLKEQGRLDAALEGLRLAVQNHTRLVERAPQYQGELELISGEAKTLFRHVALIRGERPPDNPDEQLDLAQERYHEGRFAEAVAGFAAALESEEIHSNIGQAALYNAACAAARAAAEAGPGDGPYVALALEWLAADVDLRRRALVQIDRQLADPELDASQRGRLETIRQQVERVLRLARSEDPDLANVRDLPEFRALFPE